MEKEYLSNFVEFIVKADFILRLPIFDWSINVKKTILPMRLKAGYSKKFGKKGRLTNHDLNFLFKQAKRERRDLIIGFITLQVITIAAYMALALVSNRKTGDETYLFFPILITIVSCILAIFYTRIFISYVLTQSDGNSLGLPRINGDYYEYQMMGMTVKLLKNSVDISYDDKERILITSFAGDKYIEKFKMKDFNLFKNRYLND